MVTGLLNPPAVGEYVQGHIWEPPDHKTKAKLEVDLAYKKELHKLITRENVDIVASQTLTMREIMLMVMSWYDHLGPTVAFTTKYKIAMPGVFKFRNLGWFDALPPDPRVVGVHLPGEIVKCTEFVFWELARRLLVAMASLAELYGSSTPHHEVNVKSTPRHELIVSSTPRHELIGSSTPCHELNERSTPRHEVNVSIVLSRLLTRLLTTRSRVEEYFQDWGCQGDTLPPTPGQFNPANLCPRDLTKIDTVHPRREGQDDLT